MFRTAPWPRAPLTAPREPMARPGTTVPWAGAQKTRQKEDVLRDTRAAGSSAWSVGSEQVISAENNASIL